MQVEIRKEWEKKKKRVGMENLKRIIFLQRIAWNIFLTHSSVCFVIFWICGMCNIILLDSPTIEKQVQLNLSISISHTCASLDSIFSQVTSNIFMCC